MDPLIPIVLAVGVVIGIGWLLLGALRYRRVMSRSRNSGGDVAEDARHKESRR
jgi:hypothetical protein